MMTEHTGHLDENQYIIEGRDACLMGKDIIKDNPYDHYEEEYRLWKKGFEKEEIRRLKITQDFWRK